VSAKPMVIVLSGPSGVGKDTVLDRMKRSAGLMYFAVTATTRRRRSQEVDGADYHFVSRKKFKSMIDGDELLEWAEVYGNLYGVPKDQMREALRTGRDVVIKVDIQGAETIKSLVPQALLIFVSPPSMETLERRLRKRSTESASDLNRRIATARQEMDKQRLFDYVVVNDEVGRAVSEINYIIAKERGRADREAVEL
jgi:guanylate kinase